MRFYSQCFEVNAECARAFLQTESGDEWDDYRCQAMWDAIALHTRGSFAFYKEPKVVIILYGENADFGTPTFDEPGK